MFMICVWQTLCDRNDMTGQMDVVISDWFSSKLSFSHISHVGLVYVF